MTPGVTPEGETRDSRPQGRSVKVTWTYWVGAWCHVLVGGPVGAGQVDPVLREKSGGTGLPSANDTVGFLEVLAPLWVEITAGYPHPWTHHHNSPRTGHMPLSKPVLWGH